MTEHTKGPFAPKPEHKPHPGHGCELFASKIREALDAEDWEDAEHNTDSYGQERRLYLGTVFGCTPSGKFYAPWACSNVWGCSTCAGSGLIPNYKPRKSRALAKSKVWERRRRAYRACTACGGLGSRDAHLDELWREYAESVCESVGASLENGEGDPCDLFIVEYRDTPDPDEENVGEYDHHAPDGGMFPGGG